MRARNDRLLWLKAFHVIAMVTWFAGLFYLPRLFVYHADTRDAPGVERFKVMERRLFAIMTIGAVRDPGFRRRHARGIARISRHGLAAFQADAGRILIIYHLYCYKFNRAFAAGRNARTPKWYRRVQ